MDVAGLHIVANQYNLPINKVFEKAHSISERFSVQELERAKEYLHFDDTLTLEEFHQRLLDALDREKCQNIIPFFFHSSWHIPLRNFIHWNNKCWEQESLVQHIRKNEKPVVWANNKEERELRLKLRLLKKLEDYQQKHYRTIVSKEWEELKNVDCICGDEIDDSQDMKDWVKLYCNKYIHLKCLKEAITSTGKCPYCGLALGVLNSPSGTMYLRTQAGSLKGYDKYDTIVITYDLISSRIMYKNEEAFVTGDYRSAFLPNSPKGQNVAELLKVVFKLGRMFSFGKSLTTGNEPVITFGTVHIKSSNTGTFGYPDPTYLDRVRQEILSKLIDAPIVMSDEKWGNDDFKVVDMREERIKPL
jgi:hypothetical protein